jgi:hypothetical protein
VQTSVLLCPPTNCLEAGSCNGHRTFQKDASSCGLDTSAPVRVSTRAFTRVSHTHTKPHTLTGIDALSLHVFVPLTPTHTQVGTTYLLTFVVYDKEGLNATVSRVVAIVSRCPLDHPYLCSGSCEATDCVPLSTVGEMVALGL